MYFIQGSDTGYSPQFFIVTTFGKAGQRDGEINESK